MKYKFKNKYGLIIGIGFSVSILSHIQTFESTLPSVVLEILVFSVILLLGLYNNRYIKLTKSSFILLTLLGVTFMYAVISSFWALYPRLTAQRAFLALTLPIALFLIVTVDNQRKNTFQVLSRIIIIFGSMFALTGILLYFFGEIGSAGGRTIQYITIGPVEISQNVYGPQNRISSILGNPNTLAGFLVASLPLTLILYFDSQRGLIYALGIIIQFSGLILTGSRTGTVAVVCGLTIAFFLISLDKSYRVKSLLKSNPKILAIIAVFTTIVPTMSPMLLQQRFIDISSDTLEGSGRVETWTSIWHYSMTNLQGTGFGISREVIPGVYTSPHSDYFTVLGELGIVGVVLFGLVVGVTVWYGLKSHMYAPVNDRLYLAGAIAVFVAFTVHGFAEMTITRGGGRQLFWAYFLAYIACYSKNGRQ